MSRVLVAVLLGGLALAPVARAHEVRPAYLEITETAPGRYAVLWRTPVLSGMRLPVVLKIPDGVRNVTQPTVQELTDSLVERRTIDAGQGGIAGKRVEFVGLQATITDVLVRVALLDGTRSTTLVHPSQPWVEIAATSGLGYLIMQAGDYLNTALVFSGILMIAILGLILDACLRGLLLLADPSRRR